MSLGRAKNKVFKQTLQPAGFEKGRHVFLRHARDQYHAIDFQPSKYGGSYFVNIAFGYDFHPSPDEIFVQRVRPLAEYDVIDLMLHGRPGSFLPKESGSSASGGSHELISDEALLEQMDRQVRDAMTVLERFSVEWRDPAVFLATVTPDALAEDYRRRVEKKAPPHPLDEALPGWTYNHFRLTYNLVLIARRAGRADLAARYFGFAEHIANPNRLEPAALMSLRQKLEGAEKGSHGTPPRPAV